MTLGLRALLLDIRDGIRSQPGRMGLSFLAIAVGVTALTILLSVLGGLQERSRQIIQDLGVNVFGIVQPTRATADAPGGRLAGRHIAFLAANLSGCAVAGVAAADVPVPGADRTVKVVATDSALLQVRQWRLSAGRFLDERDAGGHARVAVVSAALSRKWNWNVGGILTLRSTPYEIIGIVECGSEALETEAGDPGLILGDEVVFVPSETPPYWIDFGDPSPYLDVVFVRVFDPARFAETAARARRLLSQPDQRVSNIAWVTPESLLRRLRRLQNTIKLTVGSIAVLCLILGGTTLMSLMVANVRDRVPEIGLRRALGATPRDIASLFVLEAALVTMAAALAADIVTHLVLLAGKADLPVPIAVNAVTFTLPLLAAVGLGIAFSYWPARSAARIAPSEALRND